MNKGRWTIFDTAILLSYRRNGTPWCRIAKYVKRTEGACKSKAYHMKIGQGGLNSQAQKELLDVDTC